MCVNCSGNAPTFTHCRSLGGNVLFIFLINSKTEITFCGGDANVGDRVGFGKPKPIWHIL